MLVAQHLYVLGMMQAKLQTFLSRHEGLNHMLQAVLSCQTKTWHLFLSAVRSVCQSAFVYDVASMAWWMTWLSFFGNFLSNMHWWIFTLRSITWYTHMLFCLSFQVSMERKWSWPLWEKSKATSESWFQNCKWFFSLFELPQYFQMFMFKHRYIMQVYNIMVYNLFHLSSRLKL